MKFMHMFPIVVTVAALTFCCVGCGKSKPKESSDSRFIPDSQIIKDSNDLLYSVIRSENINRQRQGLGTSPLEKVKVLKIKRTEDPEVYIATVSAMYMANNERIHRIRIEYAGDQILAKIIE